MSEQSILRQIIQTAAADNGLPGRQRPMSTSPKDGAKCPVIPIAFARRKGGPAWRRAKGLQSWRDLAREYAERRFIRPGSLVPLPEDLLPGWRCP